MIILFFCGFMTVLDSPYKSYAPRNRPGRYKAFIPGPLSVNPTLARKRKTRTDATNGNTGRISKKNAKAEDSRMGVNQPRNALEKIGLKKGATSRSRETVAPVRSVFHEYLRVYSIEEIFEKGISVTFLEIKPLLMKS